MPVVKALVPMRHHSQRVPGKNYRPLDGKPLFHHIIQTLLEVPSIESVVVDTDSPVIKEGLASHFPAVQVLDRPERLQADEVPMNDILAYDVEQVKADYFLQTHSTNPLLTAGTIDQAVQVFFNSLTDFDSLFSVTALQTRLWNREGTPINHDPSTLLQTQDLPPVFEENSCIYIFSKQILLKRKNRIGERPYLLEIDAEEAWDIDTELDFQICDCLMRSKRG